MRSGLSVLWLFAVYLFTTRIVQSYDDEDYKKDPNYIYCYRPYEFDVRVNRTGHIYSPKYFEGGYPPEIGCSWHISFPENYRVKVTVKDMDIQISTRCSDDKLTFLGEDESKIITVLCGSELPRPVYSLKGDKMIKFRLDTDYIGTGRGFHVYYEASPDLDDCPAEHLLCKNRKCVLESVRCDGVDDCGDGTDEQNCSHKVALEPTECGVQAFMPKTVFDSDRMVGGEAAVPNSWPWQVSLQFPYSEVNGHFCGGTLINAQWVLTATHCVANKPDPGHIKIVLGAHNKFTRTPYEHVRYSDTVIAFPELLGQDMRKASFNDDISLIKLNAPVTFSKGVQPACLPPQNWAAQPGWSCYATGWGATRGSGTSDALKQMDVTVQSKDICSFNPKTQICVEKPNNSPCHGDSGGPLQCKVGDKWYVFGAASFVTTTNFQLGICTGPGARTVYANTADKTDWIREMIDKYS